MKNKNLRKKFREQKFESKIIRCKNLRLNLEDKYNLGTNLSENFWKTKLKNKFWTKKVKGKNRSKNLFGEKKIKTTFGEKN